MEDELAEKIVSKIDTVTWAKAEIEKRRDGQLSNRTYYDYDVAKSKAMDIIQVMREAGWIPPNNTKENEQ